LELLTLVALTDDARANEVLHHHTIIGKMKISPQSV